MGKKRRLKGRNYSFSIMGYSIQRLATYFIVYSVIGFIIETLFGVITKGTLESRQSVLYGPFCMIYGVGAVIMLVLLKFFNKNNNTLFWGGFIIGSVTEYVISFLGEALFSVVWWNYSEMPLNINGRICVFFSIFWGLLAIYLLSYVNPKIDKFINYLKKKVSIKKLRTILLVAIILIVLDNIVSSIALKLFYIRMIYKNDIAVENRQEIEQEYERIYANEWVNNIVNTFFSDEKVIRTFPNLKIVDANGEVKFFHSYLPDIQPYYYKFNNKLSRSISTMLRTETFD